MTCSICRSPVDATCKFCSQCGSLISSVSPRAHPRAKLLIIVGLAVGLMALAVIGSLSEDPSASRGSEVQQNPPANVGDHKKAADSADTRNVSEDVRHACAAIASGNIEGLSEALHNANANSRCPHEPSGPNPDDAATWADIAASPSASLLTFATENLTFINKNANEVLDHPQSDAIHAEMVKALINAGADVNKPDERGATALERAAFLGYAEATRVLIDAGASTDRRASDEQTPLMLAAMNCRTEVVSLLLSRGAKAVINARDRLQYTALHWAAVNDFRPLVQDCGETVQALVESGAGVNLVTRYGDTPLSLAVKNRGYQRPCNVQIVSPLLEAGANPLIKNSDGNSAVSLMTTSCTDHRVSELIIQRARLFLSLSNSPP
jgi:ankyrin repeat protein